MFHLNLNTIPVLNFQNIKQSSNDISTRLLNLSFAQKKPVTAMNKDGDVFFRGHSGPDFGDIFENFIEDFFNPSDYASFLK